MNHNRLDPAQEYRSKVEEVVYDDYKGSCQPDSLLRQALDEWQKRLRLSPEQAASIEAEVLKPCYEYEEKLNKIKAALKIASSNSSELSHRDNQGLRHLQEALQLDEDAIAVVQTMLGKEFYSQDKLDSATFHFKEAVRISNNSASAHAGLGAILFKQGRQRKGIKSFETARELFKAQGMAREAEQLALFLEQLLKSNSFWTKTVRILRSFFLGNRQKISDQFSKATLSTSSVLIEEKQREEIRNKDEKIVSYLKQIGSIRQEKEKLLEIIETMAEKETTKYDLRGAKFGGGFGGEKQEGGTFYDYSSNPSNTNLAEAAAEIQQLLEQLSQTYPTETLPQKAVVAEEAIKQIENNSTLKERVVSAIKAMGVEALMEAIDHPVANVLRAGIEAFKEPTDE